MNAIANLFHNVSTQAGAHGQLSGARSAPEQGWSWGPEQGWSWGPEQGWSWGPEQGWSW